MKKIINLFVLGFIVTGLSSCLKDKSLTLPDADGAIKNVIEFQNPDYINSGTSSLYPVYVKSFDILPSGSLNLTVNYAGVDVAPQDINVKVELDLTIITKYNAKVVADARAAAIILGEDPDDAEADVQGELFEALDPSLYTVPSLNLTIPAGQRTATFTVGLKPDKFNFDKRTALAFKIASASSGVISGNFSNIIVKVEGKNKYDGVYTVVPTAPFKDLAAPANLGRETMTAELRTINATSVGMYDGYYAVNGYGHAFAGGYYGNWSPVFTMDATDKVISVTNYYGQGTNSSARAGKITPTGVNKWTISGSSKVLEVSYIMTQAGVDRLVYAEKWTYKSAR